MPLEWFDVLVHLADPLGMRARFRIELRDRVLLSEKRWKLSFIVRMEKAGLDHAHHGRTDDRRSIEIAVTDGGRAALLAAIDSHLQLRRGVAQRSPDGDRPGRTQLGTVQAPGQDEAGL